MKKYGDEITGVELIKVEKKYNGNPLKYFYSITFKEIPEALVLETEDVISGNLIGLKIEFKINTDGIIEEFTLE